MCCPSAAYEVHPKLHVFYFAIVFFSPEIFMGSPAQSTMNREHPHGLVFVTTALILVSEVRNGNCKLLKSMDPEDIMVRMAPPESFPKFWEDHLHLLIAAASTKQPPNAACVEQPLGPARQLHHRKPAESPAHTQWDLLHCNGACVPKLFEQVMTGYLCVASAYASKLLEDTVGLWVLLHLAPGKLHHVATCGLSAGDFTIKFQHHWRQN